MGLATRTLVRVCAGGMTVFVSFVGAAMALYPGGTWWDPATRGHSFWRNFLCDLFHRHSLGGHDNRWSAVLATLGMLAMLPALAAFFALVSRLESPESRAGRVARVAGALACTTGVAIPLTPSDRFRVAHLSSVIGTSFPALLALGCALVVSLRSARGVRRWASPISALAVSAMVFSAIDAVAYAIAAVTAVRTLDWMLPVFQRLGAIALVGWMIAVVFEHARPR
jgi:hypothetical protein